MRSMLLLGTFALAGFVAPVSAVAEPPVAEKYLHDGKLADGEAALLAELRRNPRDDQARFGLGTIQFVRVVEHLGQSLHRYGLRSDRGQQVNLPFLRLPIPVNPKPETLTYPTARKLLGELIDDLAKAEATLADVRDEQIKLPLRVGLIRLDLAGNGQANDRFSAILARYFRGSRVMPAESDWRVAFDRGDVAWLRGYCHLLMALAEVALAHDGQELFDHTAHLFFAKVETPHKFLAALPERERGMFDIGGVNIVDLIALVHLIRLPVREPARMKTALAHLERTLALSRESWNYYLAETDDDDEWIPNPKQRGVLGITLRKDMVESWLAFVGESEQLLAGNKLVPFWREGDTRGVNLRRVFTEPRPLDLVLWVQGTAATPYLEEGPRTERGVWDQLLRVFGGDFMGFAVWFN